jgi:hypothetical protein
MRDHREVAQKGDAVIETNAIRNANPRAFDACYAVVRSLRRPMSGVEQLAVLSPSPQLFHDYLRWRDAGTWNLETFQKLYTPRFLDQIQNDPAAIRTMMELAYRSTEGGERIQLVCFCTDVRTCHRSILAEMFRAIGCNVVVR